MKTNRGTHASVAVQCNHPESRETGCWLFVAGNHREPGTSVSPVFSDLVDLFNWCNQTGWKEYGGEYLYEPVNPNAGITQPFPKGRW